MAKKNTYKKLLALALLAIIAFALVPQISWAQNSPPPPNPPTPPVGTLPLPTLPTNPQPTPAPLRPTNTKPQDISTNPLDCYWPGNWGACGLYWVIRAINWVMGLLIALGAVLVGFGLDLSHGLVNQNTVQAGFSVSLSIANLGFVLAIIIVALATILRRDTYGIKQLLWKIIVAAVIVNFGLVIAGTILGFSDVMTNYFTTPFGYEYNIQGSGSENFVNKLTAALSPNVFLVPPVANSSEAKKKYDDCINDYYHSPKANTVLPTDAYAQCGTESGYKYDTGDGMDDFIKLILAMVFVIVADFIIALTLMALAVMLIIRYVTLGILLIIMPLAWLLWIFPQYSIHFKQWWTTFLKWAFFPTIVTFFLFLAVQTVTSTKTGSSSVGKISPPPVAGVATDAINNQTRQPTFVPALLNLVIVVGLSIGGLFAANKMGIVGASVAMGAAKSVGNGVKNYAGRQGKKVGGAALQKVATEERLQALGRSKIPFAGMLARGTNALKEKGRKAAMDAAAEKAAKKSAEQNAFDLSTFSPITSMDKIMGTLKHLQSQGPEAIGKVKTIGGKSMGEFLKDNEKNFANYGAGGLRKEIGESNLQSEKVVNARNKVAAAQEDIEEGNKQGIAAPKMDEKKKKLEEAEKELYEATAEGLKKSPSAAGIYSKSDKEVDELAQKGKLPFGMGKAEYLAQQDAALKTALNHFTPNQFSNFVSNLNIDQLKGIKKTLDKIAAANGKSDDPRDYMNEQVLSYLKNSPNAELLGLTGIVRDIGINLEKEKPAPQTNQTRGKIDPIDFIK